MASSICNRFISKSKFLWGLLWHAYKARHLIPGPDALQQAVFDQSKQGVKQRWPLYEPAFAFDGGYARADSLVPVGADQWDLIEAKSTTSVKNGQGRFRPRKEPNE